MIIVKDRVANLWPTVSLTRARFNASRSFDLEDDMEFCPILSDEEVSTLSSAQLISYFGNHRNVSRW